MFSSTLQNSKLIFLKRKAFSTKSMPIVMFFFINPYNDCKPMSQARIGQNWREITRRLAKEEEIKGISSSGCPYTLYSIKKTFIKEKISRIIDIIETSGMTKGDLGAISKAIKRKGIEKYPTGHIY